MKDKLYLVWNEEDEESSCHYYEQYSSLEDAVSEHEDQEVFIAEPKLLGRFKLKTVLVKTKSKKK